MPGARRHRRGDRDPRRQVAVLDEMVLGEPHEVEPEPVEPRHLVQDRGVQALMAQARFGWVAEIIGDAQAQRLRHGSILALANGRSNPRMSRGWMKLRTQA